MIHMVKVTSVEALDGYRLALTFSDGSEGVENLSDFIADGGQMVEPPAGHSFFQACFSFIRGAELAEWF